MTDFGVLIEQAIERDLRNQFVRFLTQYQHLEFGRSRALTLDEAALVLTCTDRFLLDSNVLDLGVAEIVDLRARLHSIAQRPGTPTATAQANTCFDALACITALEARLCRLLDRVEVRVFQAQHCRGQFPANDI